MRDLLAILMNDFSDFQFENKMEFPKEDDPNWSKTSETLENKTHIITKETWTSKDGYSKMERTSSKLKSQKTIEGLRKKLKEAIAKEEFEKAAQLRDEIKKIS
jgi:excinuclease UvrABC helicase subunit UvrB